jgi:y4mF family transcriptional regulator
MNIRDFVKKQRKLHGLTQVDLASKAGVGLRFIRELEQGKSTLRIDKVNQVLQLFGKTLGPVEWRPETEDSVNNGEEKE